MLEKTLESPLAYKEIKSVHSKRNQPWILIGRTGFEAETPILQPHDAKSLLIRKDPDMGKIEGKRRRGWQRMRWLDGITDSMDIEFEEALRDAEGQRCLACCNSWGQSHWATEHHHQITESLAVHLKQMQHCRSTICQYKFLKKKRKWRGDFRCKRKMQVTWTNFARALPESLPMIALVLFCSLLCQTGGIFCYI